MATSDAEDEWMNLLKGHPIFSPPKSLEKSVLEEQSVLQLSTSSLPKFTSSDPEDDSLAPSGRRQVMILKDADIIVAAGKEIRMSSIGDLKLSRSVRKSYKTLHTPNIKFEIHQISLSPSGKLLAVAGAYQVAVIVLPRAGYGRLVPDTIECKAVQIGQFYHAATSSAPIAKIDWHPWGEAGSTLLVMTVDGKLRQSSTREYDISDDTEEPQQVLSFVPEKKTKSFVAEDSSEREVASFTIGKGNADWGPLTVYVVMKSGDIYSICPYMPRNASIPSAYVRSLECFISAKQEFLSQETSPSSKALSVMYDYQHKYVTALLKQVPPGTDFLAASKSVLMHPPTTIKSPPLRQGPFLLQPSPRLLEGSEGGDATDIVYLSFGTDDDVADGTQDPEHLGVVLVSYQDGKVDFFLDVEKVEARWDVKHASSHDLPVLATYETIDLGIVKNLADASTDRNSEELLDLVGGNHPVFLPDPLHDDMVYVYHAFGVHALDVSPVLQHLTAALREENEDEAALKGNLEKDAMTSVQHIVNTFSREKGSSNPVIAVSIPNDVYLTYSIFILTSVMEIISYPLNIRSLPAEVQKLPVVDAGPDGSRKSKWLSALPGPDEYVSALSNDPYSPPTINVKPPALPKDSGSPLSPRSKEFMLTPETLRTIAKAVGEIGSQIQEIHIAYQGAMARVAVQRQELGHQLAKCRDMESHLDKLKGPERQASEARFAKVQEEQKTLLSRFDRLLQALMKQASPELSEYETKWFEELKRMKQEVLGVGKYDERSLLARTNLLQKEYSRILPSLQTLVERERELGKKTAESNQSLGFSQAFEYGQRSNLDRTRIREVEKEITKLASELDLSLGQPPTP